MKTLQNKSLSKRIERSMLQGIELGLMEKAGIKDGKQMFRLTEKGKRFVEAMPFKNEIESAKWLKNYDKERKENDNNT